MTSGLDGDTKNTGSDLVPGISKKNANSVTRILLVEDSVCYPLKPCTMKEANFVNEISLLIFLPTMKTLNILPLNNLVFIACFLTFVTYSLL